MTFYNKYVIIYTSLFQNELEEILKYIAFNLNSPYIAKSFYKEITDKLYSLQYFPDRYIKINYKSKVLRKLLIHKYVVIYEINKNTRSSLYSTYIPWISKLFKSIINLYIYINFLIYSHSKILFSILV